MIKIFLLLAAIFACFLSPVCAQIPGSTLARIVRAEDERRYDQTLENLLKNPNPQIRRRAALAAGRIGDEQAIFALAALLKNNPVEVQTTAIFALGEIESAKAAGAILEILNNANQPANVRARAAEAAGKIAAANPKDAQTAALGQAVISVLQYEFGRRSASNRETILLGITAILRARPAGGEAAAAKFLDDADAQIRADALNTLARLRSKNINEKARELLAQDSDPIVRANAARMLGVGEDQTAIDLLVNAATKDVDSRVRVSAIRSLASFEDAKIGQSLIVRMQRLIVDYAESVYRKRNENPLQQTELIELTSTLGRIFANTNDQSATSIIDTFNQFDKYQSPEIEIALAKIAPSKFSEFQRNKKDFLKNRRAVNATMAGIGELANAPDSPETAPVKDFAKAQAAAYIRGELTANRREDKTLSDALRAYAAFKPADLPEILRGAITHNDANVRASAAGLFSTQPPIKENVEILKSVFAKSLLTDKRENDAQLAILNALYKLDKKAAVGTFLVALSAPDYLVRKRAAEILKDADLQKDFPGIQSSLESFAAKKGNQVLPYAAYTATKLGQIFYTSADYVRAVSRKNGTVKAVFATTKGSFAVELTPEDAPLTVDNFIALARSDYFNGLAAHRVVPNFVMQTGDPRGDGSGGPGHQIRCEINLLPFARGAVGMALSGKDTGGSQWFATHSPQPHLDGGYTVFGKINEADMKTVDNIVRGDQILTVKIVEQNVSPKLIKKRGRRTAKL